jgi:hypothetical protein
MWYFKETFLQPRTERCRSVSLLKMRTVDVKVVPLTAVLSNSRLASLVLKGFMTVRMIWSRA